MPINNTTNTPEQGRTSGRPVSRPTSAQASRQPQVARPAQSARPASAGRPASALRRTPAAAGQDARGQNPAPEQPGSGSPRRQAVKIKNRWFTAMIMVLVTLGLCFFLAMFILQSAMDLFGLNQKDRQIEVVVPQNSTLPSVSALLYDKGVVEQPFTFTIYAGYKLKDEDVIKPGNYIFNSNFAYDQIIIALKTGNTKKEVVTITFIEGSTLYEMARKLEENKVCDADDFLEYMNRGDIDYEYMNQIPSDPFRYRRLEGYAFPDTYEFYVGMDIPLVADKFLNNFEKRITQEMRDKMKERNLSIDETIILASIIQKEAGDPVEMRMVASVFENRLETPEVYPNLQSDVTIHYVDKFIKPFLDRSDQPMYDAYNTYVCEGLPAGAICNPGIDAINAVIDPEESDYYFFVTDTEGTYYYAKTAQAHYNNVVKASQVGGSDIHGTDTLDERS